MLASELCMSRSKLYSKLKALTGRSIVEFILNYRMRKAARLIVEQDVPLYRVMEQVGIRSRAISSMRSRRSLERRRRPFRRDTARRRCRWRRNSGVGQKSNNEGVFGDFWNFYRLLRS